MAPTPLCVGKVSVGSADNAGEVPAANQGSLDAAPTGRRRARATKAVAKAAPIRPAKKAAMPSEMKAAPPAPDTKNGRERQSGRQGKPSAEEIIKVYEAVGGTLTGVAEHYGKPYATVSGWARSLRDEGYQIGRARKA